MPYQSTCSHMVNLTTTPVQAIVHSKEIHVCEDCDNRGPNLWICLQQDCLQVGCSETVKNHSTYHNQLHRNHPIQLNLTTSKVWCYECSEEVFLPVPHDSDAEMDEHKYRDSGHGSYSTLRSHTPERELVYGIRRNMGMSGDTSESSDGEDNPTVNDTRPMGLVGLQNIGNTCYMNAALQALSNTAPLTSFFLECPASVYMLSEGRKPGLSRTYQTLMKDMWLRKNGGYVTPSGILCGIRNVHAMFRGFQQHDTQEFLRNFMDQLHEELKQTLPPAHVTVSPSIDRNLLSSMSSSSGGGPSNTVTMTTGGAPGGSGGPLLQQQPQSEQQRYHHNSSSYESSDGEEYETCDSGVSERSSLSDDTERVMTTPSVVQQQQKRRLSRSGSPGRRLRARKQGSTTVTDSQPCSSNPTTTTNTTKLSTSHHIPTTSTTIVPEKTASNSTITNKQQQTSNTNNNKQTSNTNNNKQQINNTNKQQTNNTNNKQQTNNTNKQQTNNTNKQQTNNNKQQTNNNKQQTNNNKQQTNNTKQQTNNTNNTSTSTNTSPTTSSKTHRSIISDIFDGKLLSSVQCLTCDRISSRVETFQDLSLPIPSRDHLVVLHGRSVAAAAAAAAAATSLTSATGSGESLTASGVTEAAAAVGAGWLSWILAWLRSWFYGPTVTLHDCLSAFFSRDELKGDNMYSCEKCNKLRNGIKYSKVLQLPEVLCIHLKRFRHELMYSSKISASVIFPLRGLDMRPYLHEECVSQVTGYELFSVICHHGTAGGGHYTCYALNNNQWYEFDDQYVTETTADQVLQCEAYVLFYRKCHSSPGSHDSSPRSQRNHVNQIALQLINDHNQHHQLHQYSHWQSDDEARDHQQQQVAYVSKQWLSRFKTCAEPGPIDNADFLCIHGGVAPGRERDLSQVATRLPLSVYEYLLDRYGGCVPVQTVTVCSVCTKLLRKISYELDTFLDLNAEFQGEGDPPTHFLATSWYVQWHNFVQKHTLEPPGPIDNTKLESGDTDDCVEVNEAIWSFFTQCYGGGPEIRISAPPPPPTLNLTSSAAPEEDTEDANYSQPPPSYPATTTVTPPPPCHTLSENNDTCPPPPVSMDVDDKIPEFVIPTRRRNNDNKHKANKHNSTTTAIEICNNMQSSAAAQVDVTAATVLPTVTNDGGDGDCDSAVNDASTSIGGSDSSVVTGGRDPSPGPTAAVVNGYGMNSADTEMATVDNNETSTSSATITTASQKRNANTRYRRRMRDVN